MTEKTTTTQKWKEVKSDFDQIKGDEKLIKDNWEKQEIRAVSLIYRLLKC